MAWSWSTKSGVPSPLLSGNRAGSKRQSPDSPPGPPCHWSSSMSVSRPSAFPARAWASMVAALKAAPWFQGWNELRLTVRGYWGTTLAAKSVTKLAAASCAPPR